MGISDLQKVTAELTLLPIMVLNSHTHNDHVGDNWEFDTVYGMDTDFTRANAKGSRQDAQDELGPGMIVASYRKALTPGRMQPGLGKSRDFFTITTRSISEAARWKFSLPPATLRTRFDCLIALTGCFPGDTYYPAPIWLYRPETNLDEYVASVKHLAALAPQIRLVLGQHNVPFARTLGAAAMVLRLNLFAPAKCLPNRRTQAKRSTALTASHSFSALMRWKESDRLGLGSDALRTLRPCFASSAAKTLTWLKQKS